MKFPKRIYMGWDSRGPFLLADEALKEVVADEPTLVGVYSLVSEVEQRFLKAAGTGDGVDDLQGR